MLSEGSSNGPACIDGVIEGSDGEQEGFLNLLCVWVMRVFECVQECVEDWGRRIKFEF